MNYDIKLIGSVDDVMVSTLVEGVDAYAEGETVSIFLNSEGGSASDAIAMVDYMRTSGRKYSITAFGLCQSAAVIILACGDYRRIAKGTEVMVHEEYVEEAGLTGTLSELEKKVAAMREEEDRWNDLLASKTKVSARYWAGLAKETTYLTAEECLELGLVDEVI